MVLTMYVAVEDSPETDERILGIAVEQSLLAAQLGYNPWFTEHHFRGSWHSNCRTRSTGSLAAAVTRRCATVVPAISASPPVTMRNGSPAVW